jgi:hypothetical protein
MADYQNPYLGQNNPYLQQNIDKAQGDLVRNYNLTTQPAYNSAMVKSGSFGNAGVQQMNENAQKNLQGSLGDVSNSMRMQDYNNQQGMYKWDSEFNRNLYNDSYSQNMNNLTTGVGLLGTLAGYNANDLTNANNIQNTPFNYWSQFSNAANGMGQGYGTSTSQMGSSSSPLTSALGGAQLGQAAMGWWNRSNQQQAAYDNGSQYNTGTQYLPSGYDALGFPNGQ